MILFKATFVIHTNHHKQHKRKLVHLIFKLQLLEGIWYQSQIKMFTEEFCARNNAKRFILSSLIFYR